MIPRMRLFATKAMLKNIAFIGIVILAIIGFGSAFQGENGDTWFSIPTLWLFVLILLPVLLFTVINVFWNRHDRTSR